MTESDDATNADAAADCLGVVADIAALARKLAATEPYQSMRGPEALQALASSLDAIAVTTEPDRGKVVPVTVRKRRKPGDA